MTEKTIYEEEGLTAFRYRLNGTDKNPFTQMGLTRNPFGQINKAELDGFEALLLSLEGEPIKDEQDLRNRLKLVKDKDFVNYLVSMYEPGKTTTYQIFVNLNTAEVKF